MPKMQIVTDAMLDRAGVIGSNNDRILSSQNAVTQIFQNMGHDFSGRVPGLMTQHMISMEKDYTSMNNILNNYKAFMEDAARNYEWTEDELARWAESLGNGQQNSASSASSSANSESSSSSSASNSSAGSSSASSGSSSTSASESSSSSSDSAGASAAPAASAADDGVNTGAGHNYDAANYQGYVQNHGGNCYSFVNQVLTDQGRGSLSGWDNAAYLNGHDTITGGQFIVSDGKYPSGDDIKNMFTNAQVGDVVQMRWAYQAGSTSPHTAIISSIDENGVTFLHSHISGSNVKNSTYSWDELARRYSNVGNGGGASIYRF